MANSNRFVGTWRLIRCEHKMSDGTSRFPWGLDAKGLLLYTSDGYMSAFLMKADRHRFASDDIFEGTASERVDAMESCLAYAGRYRVEEKRVVHIVELSPFPNWIGSEQIRLFEWRGAQLILSSLPFQTSRGEETAYLTWERAAI